MTVIGLTGTSGSGKGAVSNIMAKNGAYNWLRQYSPR